MAILEVLLPEFLEIHDLTRKLAACTLIQRDIDLSIAASTDLTLGDDILSAKQLLKSVPRFIVVGSRQSTFFSRSWMGSRGSAGIESAPV